MKTLHFRLSSQAEIGFSSLKVYDLLRLRFSPSTAETEKVKSQMNSRISRSFGFLMALASSTILPSAHAKTRPHSVNRPPQFVVLAFDGSKSLGMWQETRKFAKDMTAAGKPVKFTYFINA